VPASLKRRLSDSGAQAIANAPASGVVDVDFKRHMNAIASTATVLKVASQSNGDSFGGKLEHVENAVHELETTLSRIERGNKATLDLFRGFVDWVRSRERGPGDRT
jgi:hypothetical protein